MFGSDLRNGLVRECNVLLQGDAVFDLPQDDGKCDKQTSGEKTPVGGEHVHIWDLGIIEAPGDSATSGLDALVETGKVGKFASVVGQGTHEPVDTCLPSRIGKAVEHVEDERTGIASVGPVLLLVVLVLGPGAIISLLEHVAETPDDHNGGQQHSPGNLGTSRSADALVVKSKAKDIGANNLHDVVDYAIERTCAGVEVGAVDLGEVVCVEPIGGEEHGEEQNDIWVGEKGLVQAFNLRAPGWVLHDDDLGAVGADDIPCIDQRP